MWTGIGSPWMLGCRKLRIWVLFSLLAAPLCAQMQFTPPQMISSDDALDRALKNNVLTNKGTPFHAVLEIGAEKEDLPAFKGRVELFWETDKRYRLILESQDFGQTLIVNDGQVMETDRGDFYPTWLRGFVIALMDPMPRLKDLRGRQDRVAVGPKVYSCVRRDDRPGGITDEMTWAQVCFSGDEPMLQFAMDFTYNMEFHDFQKFGEETDCPLLCQRYWRPCATARTSNDPRRVEAGSKSLSCDEPYSACG